jgi:hypothetical protein
MTATVTIGGISAEIVTETVQNTVTATGSGSPDLTEYLILGVAIIVAAGLLGFALVRWDKRASNNQGQP